MEKMLNHRQTLPQAWPKSVAAADDWRVFKMKNFGDHRPPLQRATRGCHTNSDRYNIRPLPAYSSSRRGQRKVRSIGGKRTKPEAPPIKRTADSGDALADYVQTGICQNWPPSLPGKGGVYFYLRPRIMSILPECRWWYHLDWKPLRNTGHSCVNGNLFREGRISNCLPSGFPPSRE
jgi:hypothetical protein